MTRRSLFKSIASAFTGCVLAKTAFVAEPVEPKDEVMTTVTTYEFVGKDGVTRSTVPLADCAPKGIVYWINETGFEPSWGPKGAVL